MNFIFPKTFTNPSPLKVDIVCGVIQYGPTNWKVNVVQHREYANCQTIIKRFLFKLHSLLKVYLVIRKIATYLITCPQGVLLFVVLS